MPANKKVELEKVWKDTKEHLSKLTKDTLDMLKRGEEEIVKLSGKAKTNFEAMVLKLKKEQLFYLLGKESFKLLKKTKVNNAKVANLVNELKDIDKQIAKSK